MVLVVDDNEDIRLILEIELALAGYQVESVSDAPTALSRLRDVDHPRVDLVVTDGMMPKMSGPQLVAAMRADTALLAIPVIGIDGIDPASWERSWGPVADALSGYLSKPFDIRELCRLVEEVLGGRRGGIS